MTPASASQVDSPARQNRCQRRGSRQADCRSSTASATIDVITHSTPRIIAASLRVVGAVMNRVSTSTGRQPGWAGTFSSVNSPATCGFLSADSVPVAPGMPTKSAPTAPGFAHTCSVLQAPDSTAARGATADGVPGDDDGVSAGPHEHAVAAGVDADRRYRREHQAAAVGQVATAAQGDADVDRRGTPTPTVRSRH